jgi:hypothetical protein
MCEIILPIKQQYWPTAVLFGREKSKMGLFTSMAPKMYLLLFLQAYYFSRSDVALFGLHKFFKKMSDEERDHGQKLMEYVNKRGGTISMESTLTFSHQDKVLIIRSHYSGILPYTFQ